MRRTNGPSFVSPVDKRLYTDVSRHLQILCPNPFPCLGSMSRFENAVFSMKVHPSCLPPAGGTRPCLLSRKAHGAASGICAFRTGQRASLRACRRMPHKHNHAGTHGFVLSFIPGFRRPPGLPHRLPQEDGKCLRFPPSEKTGGPPASTADGPPEERANLF